MLELAGESPERGSVLDVGTGSGVLAIAVARLGFGPVLALDNDPASVEAASANAELNAASLEIRRLDLRSERLPGPDGTSTRVRLMLANLLRPLLLELSEAIVEPPVHLIAAGLLRGECDEIVASFSERHALHERQRRHSGEWSAVWLSAD